MQMKHYPRVSRRHLSGVYKMAAALSATHTIRCSGVVGGAHSVGGLYCSCSGSFLMTSVGLSADLSSLVSQTQSLTIAAQGQEKSSTRRDTDRHRLRETDTPIHRCNIHGVSVKTKLNCLCRIYVMPDHIIIILSRYLDNSTKNNDSNIP